MCLVLVVSVVVGVVEGDTEGVKEANVGEKVKDTVVAEEVGMTELSPPAQVP